MKSITNSEALKKLASIERENVYRDWWRFQYTNRYFKQLLLDDEVTNENVDRAFCWLTDTFDRFKSPGLYPDKQSTDYVIGLFEFTNSLVYAYHKRTQADGFLDIRYEVLLYEHDYPFAKIPAEDIEFVEYLHRLTIELGYLVLPLDGRPDYTASWEMFIDGEADFDPTTMFAQTFSYPKIGVNPKGIQISTIYNPRKVEGVWDTVIYCSLDDTDSHLKEKVAELWEPGGKHEVGNSEDYDIALFIESDKCTPNSVLMALKLQVRWTLITQLGRSVAIVDGKNKSESTDVRPHKKLKKLESDMLEALKLSEGLVEKRKDVEKDNVRRAVGLYLWDEIRWSSKQFKSKESLIKETVRSFEKDKLFVLEHYRGGYEKDMEDVSKGLTAFNTVVREMLIDLDVTDYCIKHGDFFNYNQVKAAKGKS